MKLHHALVALCSIIASASCESGAPRQELAGHAPDGGESPVDAPILIADAGDDPCAAGTGRSYIGCDAWPTPVANPVWNVFDFAVIVANAADQPAAIKVERDGTTVTTATVAPNGIAKIFLPWVPELKGNDADHCGNSISALPKTVRVDGGAYHLTSNRPVTVYQFNALEYAPVGGPPKKDWSSCPGDHGCSGISCFSYSNDASILFPSTALTGTYRVTGVRSADGNAYFAITATKDDTKVHVRLSGTGRVVGGGGLKDTLEHGALDFKMNAGDVVELAAPPGDETDLSGSLVTADKPVQVIAGHPCTTVPKGLPACDHVEESVAPAETFGKHYLVAQPTGPYGGIPGHVVRLYGNVDGTNLTYAPSAPANAPTVINAGEVFELGSVDRDFEVIGDHEFAVTTLMKGAGAVDPDGREGDPSLSTAVAVEQYRTKYVFLAADDYDSSYVDALQPLEATLTLDGKVVTTKPTPIGNSGFGVARIRLSDSNTDAHVIESSVPFGIQVLGYGKFTSYQYPGGLDLKLIAPPPK